MPGDFRNRRSTTDGGDVLTQHREFADELAARRREWLDREWLERPALTDHLLGALAEVRRDREEMIGHFMDALDEAEQAAGVIRDAHGVPVGWQGEES